MAKLIIKLIHAVGEVVNADPRTRDAAAGQGSVRQGEGLFHEPVNVY
jgi:hypothetical protein